jgi:hypothetical protein
MEVFYLKTKSLFVSLDSRVLAVNYLFPVTCLNFNNINLKLKNSKTKNTSIRCILLQKFMHLNIRLYKLFSRFSLCTIF